MSKAQVTVETAQQIADIVSLFDLPWEKGFALTAITNGTVGIAVSEEGGYIPTQIGLAEYNYHKLEGLCDEANSILYPKRSPKESCLIVLRSMRK